MSALSGIWYFDGRPVTDADLQCLTTASLAEGPDRTGTVRPRHGLALQTHHLHFDRLSANERQPLFFAQQAVLTWDGRLDNREDLLVVLHRDLGDDCSDAALVAAAYARWDLACLPRLIGDWSLALWDAPRERMVLARDYMGNRQLYYRPLPEGGVAWATCVDALAECFDLYDQPNETYIANRLAGTGLASDTTHLTGLYRLAGGHVLVVSPQYTATRRYWTFTPASLRYRDRHIYTEHLRALLTEAVRVRLRADRPVWSQLSGGWDSSSVSCLAHALIKRGDVEAPSVHLVSGITGDSPETNSLPYIEAVERWCGLTAVRQEWSAFFPSFADLQGHRRPSPNLMAGLLDAPVRAAGSRVVLTGVMGDRAMMQSAFHRVSVVEPLQDGHPLRFIQVCQALSRAEQRPLGKNMLWPILYAYLPSRYYRPLRAWRARREGKHTEEAGPIAIADAGLTPRLRAQLYGRAPNRTPSVAHFPAVKRGLVEALYITGDDGGWAYGTLSGVLHTHPFMHRPLVEFVIAVPQLALWSPTFPRQGMHDALADVLPAKILTHVTKGDAATSMARAKIRWVGDFIEAESRTGWGATWEIVKRGYVERAVITSVLQALQTRDNAPDVLFRWFQLEAWLRNLATLARRARDRGDAGPSLRSASGKQIPAGVASTG